jgi:long-chain acyl-CoA synthetase
MPKFDAESLLQLIEQHRVTSIVMVPTMFVRLLRLPLEVRRRYDISSLRSVHHAAAPCPPDVKHAMIEWFGPIIHEWYGTTESSVVTACNSEEWLAHPGTVGRAIKGARIEIVDDHGAIAPPGQPGELYVGLDFYPDFTYHKRDDDRRQIGRNGLITGGDVGYLDEDGYLFLCDRKKDMVISGGVNIYPSEIESALLSIAAVHDCAVIGIPDPEYGEAVFAVVVQDGSIDEATIRDVLAKRLARYKLPKTIEFRDSLPRDDAGKLLKRSLREPYWRDATRQI